MNANRSNRKYLAFDPAKGFPKDESLFYECLRCGDVVPSDPDDDEIPYCKCRNVMIDVGYGRMDVEDLTMVRLFKAT